MSASVRFAVVTAAYQCENWVARGIASLRAQTHANFRTVLIDDQSADRTYERAQAAAAGDARFTILRSEQRVGALANIVRNRPGGTGGRRCHRHHRRRRLAQA